MTPLTELPAPAPIGLPVGYLVLRSIPPQSVQTDKVTTLLNELTMRYAAVSSGYSLTGVLPDEAQSDHLDLNLLITELLELAGATQPIDFLEALFVPHRRLWVLNVIEFILSEFVGPEYLKYFHTTPVDTGSALMPMVYTVADQKITNMVDDLTDRMATLTATGATDADHRDLTAIVNRLTHFTTAHVNVLPVRAYRALFGQIYDEFLPTIKALPSAAPDAEQDAPNGQLATVH